MPKRKKREPKRVDKAHKGNPQTRNSDNLKIQTQVTSWQFTLPTDVSNEDIKNEVIKLSQTKSENGEDRKSIDVDLLRKYSTFKCKDWTNILKGTTPSKFKGFLIHHDGGEIEVKIDEDSERKVAFDEFHDFVDISPISNFNLPEFQNKVSTVLCQLEIGEENKYIHWQGVIKFKRSMRLASAKNFFPTDKVHLTPISGLGGGFDKSLNYCVKEDTSVPNTIVVFGAPLFIKSSANQKNPYEYILKIKCNSANEFMDAVKENLPADFILRLRAIEYFASKLFTSNMLQVKPIFLKDDFYEEFTDKLPSPIIFMHKLIFIHGPSGTGKSSLAKMILPHAILMSTKEDLKSLDFSSGEYGGIVIDDCPVKKFCKNGEEMIHLCDIENSRSFDVKYGSATLPAYFPRIITSNNSLDEYIAPLKVSDAHRAAIERRVYVLPVMENIIKPKSLEEASTRPIPGIPKVVFGYGMEEFIEYVNKITENPNPNGDNGATSSNAVNTLQQSDIQVLTNTSNDNDAVSSTTEKDIENVILYIFSELKPFIFLSL